MSQKLAFSSPISVSHSALFSPVVLPVLSSRPLSYHRHRSYRCALSARRPPPPSSPRPPTPVEPGLIVPRQSVESVPRSGRAFRLRRSASLSELDIHDNPDPDSQVQVAAVIQRVRRDYRIRGKTRASLPRKCDRCAKEYVAESRGDFEVWLATDESGELEMDEEEQVQVEAVELFAKGVTEIDLTDHVRDAVYLGMPTKSLCSVNCEGVEARGDAGSVTYAIDGEVPRSNIRVAEQLEAGERTMADMAGVGEQLRQLKESLERNGL